MPYQTTHNTGGTIMGDNPTNSVVNKYLQSWDVSNLFVMGSGAFPQNAGYNPTGTVAALAYLVGRRDQEPVPQEPGRAGAAPEGRMQMARKSRITVAAVALAALVRRWRC